MVVREKVGRKRYIAFELVEGPELTRSRLSRALDGRLRKEFPGSRIEVILIVEGKGILRTDHRSAERTIEVLNEFDMPADGFKLRTLKTSGTIRKLKKRYFPGYDSQAKARE